ncbi:unnamed protein product [Schistosoma mattheei]|uniref:Uncharacterized protein n=1 Tax=Schistosoma mattheei TaxID=31246 RepID=A0A183Q158_9TREM|nr:unnamed protein product [Schistosoma mattheei]
MEYLTNSDLNNNFLINNNTINHNHNHNHNSNNTICLSPTSLNFNNASSYYSPHLINFPPEQINTEFDHHQHQHHNENVKAKLNDKLLINTKLPTYHEISSNNNNSGDIINPVNIHEDNFNSLNIVNSSINNKTGKKTRNSVKTRKSYCFDLNV